ncbi:MAG: hypothetical protein WKF84_17350 [Pyrinomonadaceae bacterium]
MPTNRPASRPLFEQIIATIPTPVPLRDDSLQLLVANLDYNEYVGRLAIGRIFSGEIEPRGNDRHREARRVCAENTRH